MQSFGFQVCAGLAVLLSGVLVSSCSVEDMNQMSDCADAASLQLDAMQARQLGRSDAASIQAQANRASAQCDDSVNTNLDSEYGPSSRSQPRPTSGSGSGSYGGINTDPSNGVCNFERFMQDPDC